MFKIVSKEIELTFLRDGCLHKPMKWCGRQLDVLTNDVKNIEGYNLKK